VVRQNFGDRLTLLTDGVPEATRQGELFSFERTASEMSTLRFRRGIGDSMHTRGKPMQHGKPRAWSSATTNRKPVTDGPGAMETKRQCRTSPPAVYLLGLVCTGVHICPELDKSVPVWVDECSGL
jgi:hypothetical protein